MHILIGSQAMAHWFPDMARPNRDRDVLSTEPLTHFQRCEWDAHHEPEWTMYEPELVRHVQDGIATPDFLYTLKVSHSFWDIKWGKTITHIVLLKRRGCQLNAHLYDIFYRTWERVHGAKRANLNMSNEEFFTEYVKRRMPHDELHEYFKKGATPKYAQLKRDPTKALISRSMFFAQPYEEQLNTVREEMLVLAAERYANKNTKGACVSALKLLITSASKGWFPLFIVDNYEAVLRDTAGMEQLKELQKTWSAQ